MQKQLRKYFAFFALPTLLAFAISFVVPFVLGIYLSFTTFTTVTNATWVGFANYSRVFSDPDFLRALWFTVRFTIVSVLTINVFAFLIPCCSRGGYAGQMFSARFSSCRT